MSARWRGYGNYYVNVTVRLEGIQNFCNIHAESEIRFQVFSAYD